jgi:ubiquinone/menaquinone biosynthesis C-methylase UbiE
MDQVNSEANLDNLRAWRDSAPFWDKHRATIQQMFAPVTNALIEDAVINPGQYVLDLATGPGEPALTIAGLVGPEGKVIGIDQSPEMVQVAAREASCLGYGHVRFEVASVEGLPFQADTFDAVVSRFGVMFFPSPIDAVREMLRVLKPGRKLALAVWSFPERNSFHYALADVIERFVPTPPGASDNRDAFRFAAPGKLRDILAEAGAVAPTERLLQFSVQASISIEEFWAMRAEMSDKLREKIAKLSPGQFQELTAQAVEALRPYATDQGVSLPAEVLIVSGSA